MAATPEGKVKKWLIKALTKSYPDMWRFSAPGGRFGRKGVPDFICGIRGVFVAIEVKTLTGKLTPMQSHELEKIKKSEGIAAVIYGEDEDRLNAIRRAVDKKADKIQG